MELRGLRARLPGVAFVVAPPTCRECGLAAVHAETCSIGKRQEAEQQAAKEWLAHLLEKHQIDWDKLTPAQRLMLTRHIPCFIRCWRVGGPVDVKPGEVCSECGQKQVVPTFWEKLPLGVG